MSLFIFYSSKEKRFQYMRKVGMKKPFTKVFFIVLFYISNETEVILKTSINNFPWLLLFATHVNDVEQLNQ